MGQVKYISREFTSKFLLDTVLNDDSLIVENKAVDSSKWGTEHKLIFKHEDKFYLWYYETIPQDGIQIHDEVQECFEVVPTAKVITVYNRVPETIDTNPESEAQ